MLLRDDTHNKVQRLRDVVEILLMAFSDMRNCYLFGGFLLLLLCVAIGIDAVVCSHCDT